MAEFNQLLWALDNEIQPREFERLCVDLLGREGYHHIIPIGGTQDHGRDAEFRCWHGAADNGSVVAFQFSLQETWEKKLRDDIEKIKAHVPDITVIVFVSSRAITGAKQDQLRAETKSQSGCSLIFYAREWLRHRLSEVNPDLAKKYLGVDLPKTVGYGAVLMEIADVDEEALKQIFPETSLDMIRTSILESTRKEPSLVRNWHRLAGIEYTLRNYTGALEAVTKALGLAGADTVRVINLTNLRGAILAEFGIQGGSRPMLIEAQAIFRKAIAKLGRYGDYFNLANVLGALGEEQEATTNYLHGLDLKPDHAEAWKNLGTLFLKNGERERGMDCFEKALQYKPNLVEAHLSKATALLMFYNQPEEAIKSFEYAYKLDPSLDRRWRYGRYWYAKSLLLANRDVEALNQTEWALALHPDDKYLLDQKAMVLGKMRRYDRSWEAKAVDFLRFRAEAIPEDYKGLAELIEIFGLQGGSERAWPFIETNLQSSPYSLENISRSAGLPINDFKTGFRKARLYKRFRDFCSLEDHCAKLHSNGLSPNPAILPALNYALMAPFGRLMIVLSDKHAPICDIKMRSIFDDTSKVVTSIFLYFGPNWLTKSKPTEREIQINLLSTGMLYLCDVILAETSRLIGFTAGQNGISSEVVQRGSPQEWSDFISDVGVRLLEEVFKVWEIPTKGNADSNAATNDKKDHGSTAE